MSGFATMNTVLGPVKVSITEDQFNEVAESLADEDNPGWDIGIVLFGLKDTPDGPHLVGGVVRVPNAVDPIEAYELAQKFLGDNNLLPKGSADSVKAMVYPLNQFGTDEDDDGPSYDDLDEDDV